MLRKWVSVPVVLLPLRQTPMKELYHVLNCALGTVNMAANSSFFCPLTLRGGLGRRPSSPVAFPHLNYDVSSYLKSFIIITININIINDAFNSN